MHIELKDYVLTQPENAAPGSKPLALFAIYAGLGHLVYSATLIDEAAKNGIPTLSALLEEAAPEGSHRLKMLQHGLKNMHAGKPVIENLREQVRPKNVGDNISFLAIALFASLAGVEGNQAKENIIKKFGEKHPSVAYAILNIANSLLDRFLGQPMQTELEQFMQENNACAALCTHSFSALGLAKSEHPVLNTVVDPGYAYDFSGLALFWIKSLPTGTSDRGIFEKLRKYYRMKESDLFDFGPIASTPDIDAVIEKWRPAQRRSIMLSTNGNGLYIDDIYAIADEYSKLPEDMRQKYELNILLAHHKDEVGQNHKVRDVEIVVREYNARLSDNSPLKINLVRTSTKHEAAQAKVAMQKNCQTIVASPAESMLIATGYGNACLEWQSAFENETANTHWGYARGRALPLAYGQNFDFWQKHFSTKTTPGFREKHTSFFGLMDKLYAANIPQDLAFNLYRFSPHFGDQRFQDDKNTPFLATEYLTGAHLCLKLIMKLSEERKKRLSNEESAQFKQVAEAYNE